jgi:hypothetical protein
MENRFSRSRSSAFMGRNAFSMGSGMILDSGNSGYSTSFETSDAGHATCLFEYEAMILRLDRPTLRSPRIQKGTKAII